MRWALNPMGDRTDTQRHRGEGQEKTEWRLNRCCHKPRNDWGHQVQKRQGFSPRTFRGSVALLTP